MKNVCIAVIRNHQFSKSERHGEYFSAARELLTSILNVDFGDDMGFVGFGKSRNTARCKVEINKEVCICRLNLTENTETFTATIHLELKQKWWRVCCPKSAHGHTKEVFGKSVERELRQKIEQIDFDWISENQWLAEY